MGGRSDLMDEHFVPVPGFSNYEVSNYGRVCNVTRGKDLTPRIDKEGFHNVALYHNGVRREFGIHRLVAQVFFVDYDKDIEIKHRNGDRSENTVRNLTLGPKIRIKVRIKETGQEFASMMACAEALGSRAWNVKDVIEGRRRSLKGYTFEVVDSEVSK